MSKNENTTMIKRMEEREPYNLYLRTQDALTKENDNKDFFINYELAFRTISNNIDLDKIRKIINENTIETKAVTALLDRSEELFGFFIKQNLCCMVSTVISIVYDFANNVLKFNDEQLQMIRNDLYPQKVVNFDMFPSVGSVHILFNDMVNHIGRKTLMYVEDPKQTPEQKKKSDITNKFVIQFETESCNNARYPYQSDIHMEKILHLLESIPLFFQFQRILIYKVLNIYHNARLE